MNCEERIVKYTNLSDYAASNCSRNFPARLVANLFLVLAASTLLSQCSQVESNTSTYSIDKPYHYLTNIRNWYSSGDLHGEDARAWEVASYENKLATSTDLVVTMWQRNMLTSDIRAGIARREDTRPLAEELVRELDAAFAGNSLGPEYDPASNNHDVTEAAAMVGVMKGWIRL